MPLPKFSTLYLHFDSNKVNLSKQCPSIGQLGRFWATRKEAERLERVEKFKEEKKEMAFSLIDISTLPVREFGRRATEPRVVFSEVGRFNFNVLIQKQWEEIGKLLVQYDADNRLLAFKGFKAEDKPKAGGKEIPEAAFLKLVRGKKDGSMSASGAGILAKIGYDFQAAGNQSFEAKWDDKVKMYVVSVPKETPAKRPVQVRTKKLKIETKAVTAPNGAVANIVAPPAEEDLLDIS